MSATIIEISNDEIKLDANHHLAGKTLTFDMKFLSFAELVLGPPKDNLQRATFGLGCFWGKLLQRGITLSIYWFSYLRHNTNNFINLSNFIFFLWFRTTGAELAYQRIEGVVSTKVGYSHGQTENPNYKQVCSGSTGHVEVVAVDFDPKVVSYEKLLDLFWERLGQNALTLNQVGNCLLYTSPSPRDA